MKGCYKLEGFLWEALHYFLHLSWSVSEASLDSTHNPKSTSMPTKNHLQENVNYGVAVGTLKKMAEGKDVRQNSINRVAESIGLTPNDLTDKSLKKDKFKPNFQKVIPASSIDKNIEALQKEAQGYRDKAAEIDEKVKKLEKLQKDGVLEILAEVGHKIVPM
jgi:adenylosuccinate lyase